LPDGRSLGVLAREVRKLSAEVARRAGDVSQVLSEIGVESERLDRVSRSGLGRGNGRIEEIVTVLDRVVKALRLFEGELGGSVERLSAESERLRSEVDRVAEQLGRQSEANGSLDRVCEDLSAVADEAAKRASLAGDGGAMLRAAADRYTMEGERAVHRSVSGKDASSLVRPDDRPAGEFGENVELF
jgi:methyl-accepting chemotaxis protein